MKQPDLLIFITDQQNASMLSCAGNPWLKTPAMDRLATEGCRFTRAVCSNPVCIPSRYSLVTGRLPSHIGLHSNVTKHLPKILPRAATDDGLGHLLRKAGYDAVFAGKQHFPSSEAAHYGFDVLTSDERAVCAATCADYLKRPRTRPLALVVSLINPHDICLLAITAFAQTDLELFLVDKLRLECDTVLRAAALRPPGISEADFFANHCPPLPTNFEPPADEPISVLRRLTEHPFRMHARRSWGEREWRLHRWAYARLTEQVDAEIGTVLDAVDTSGKAQDTVVIMTSDHGDMDASRRLEHKSLPYQEAVGVPLLMRGPGIPAGRVVKEPWICNGTDLLPTCCDYAGAAIPSDLPGASLRPLAEGKTSAWRTSLRSECETGPIAYQGRYKLISWRDGEKRDQLFDLAADPGEQRDLSRDPTLATILADLRTTAFPSPTPISL